MPRCKNRCVAKWPASDDATSRLMHLKFVETESTFDYFHATREYLEAYGKPVAFYSDKHGVFRVNSAGAVEGVKGRAGLR